ncbi:TetR/AcrR family transcriptional regulator [Gordonia sp. SL306]|uniref:TetR/AcrR family transcriptional regulator n=1 Tax=Gordonia sp. SL306 TaxID=2995145 RepID=UPI00226FB563|nr:TetR-like C-terminal domain-containing protein [Gordonia sp. SL306]WAC54750.1 TetR-like C-terminal domain-containing protein [Gordonia sp. SL306]
MGVHERKARDKQERERKIVDCARSIADSEGWAAVTTRRLAGEIEYSPPVLYGHFPDGRDGIVSAVALAGFADFTSVMRQALDGADATDRLGAFIEAYLTFAAENPATYEAMFSMQLGVQFAHDSTPAELRAAFDVLVDAVGGDHADDAGTRAELLWSALHGMSALTRGQRLSPGNRRRRVDALAELFDPTS